MHYTCIHVMCMEGPWGVSPHSPGEMFRQNGCLLAIAISALLVKQKPSLSLIMHALLYGVGGRRCVYT